MKKIVLIFLLIISVSFLCSCDPYAHITIEKINISLKVIEKNGNIDLTNSTIIEEYDCYYNSKLYGFNYMKGGAYIVKYNCKDSDLLSQVISNDKWKNKSELSSWMADFVEGNKSVSFITLDDERRIQYSLPIGDYYYCYYSKHYNCYFPVHEEMCNDDYTYFDAKHSELIAYNYFYFIFDPTENFLYYVEV